MTKLENKEFTIVPDVRTYKMLRDEMRAVYQELCRIRENSGISKRLEAKLNFLQTCSLVLEISTRRAHLKRQTISFPRWSVVKETKPWVYLKQNRYLCCH